MPTWLRPLNFFTAILLISLEINPLLTPSVSFSASNVAQTTTDRKAQAARLVQEGDRYYYQGQYQVTLEKYQQALAIYQQIADRQQEGVILNNIGFVYTELGQSKQALPFYQQALVIFQELNDLPNQGAALNNIGLSYSYLGENSKSLKFLQQALEIFREVHDRAGEGKTLNIIGGVYRSLGQISEALKFYEQALAIRRELQDRSGEGFSLNNIAEVSSLMGEYPKALDLYQQAITIFKEVNDFTRQSIVLNNIGWVYDRLGQYKKSLDFYEKALAIARNIKNPSLASMALNNMGSAYNNLKDYTNARKSYQEALEIAQELNDPSGEAKILSNLGSVDDQLQQYSQALDFYQRSLAISRKIKERPSEGITLNNLGRVYNSLGEYQKSLELYQQALGIAREVKDRVAEGRTLNNMGRTVLLTGNAAVAEKYLFETINIWESLRSGLTDENKISLLETQTNTYHNLEYALIVQQKSEAALEVTERGRARAFVELLAAKYSETPDPPIQPPNLEQIQQIAQEHEATLVEYSINDFGGQPKLYIWVVKPSGEILFRQLDIQSFAPSLENFVTSTRQSIGVRGRSSIEVVPLNSSEAKNQLKQLHKLLIEPIADLLPSDPNAHVIFMPQGELFLVPFPALQDENGKYLIEKHTILTAPAIQVLDLTQKQRVKVQQANPKGLVVVGNPTMPKVTIKIGEPPEQLNPLPAAENEAITIAKLLNTKALTGNQATKKAILSQLPQARIIHLATHGLLDDFKGLGVPGAIALAPSGNDNGLLTADEILNLKLNAELVVLSACDTGRGRITGDGVIGLSRSLITAGVPSIIVSLWSVPDAPTASLMTEFYRNWQEKKLDKAQALRQAMLTTMKNHPNPKDWAAFTLIGEAE